MSYSKSRFHFLHTGIYRFRAFLATVAISAFHLRIYDTNEILSFGYTKSFLGIAKAPLINGKLASNLTTDSMGLYFSPSSNDYYVNVFREPLYPYFLKLCFSLNLNIQTIIFIQQIILVATLFLVLSYFSKNISEKFFWVAVGVILLFCKVPFFYSSVCYPFSLSNFFLITGLLLLVGKKRKNIQVFYAGVFFGISIIERQPFFFFLIALVTLFAALRRYTLRQVLLILVGALTPLLILNSLLASSGGIRISSAGYNLGYAYGNQLSAFSTEQSSDTSVQLFSNINLLGADSGTLLTIAQIADEDNLGLRKADSRIAKLIISKLVAHPEVILTHAMKNGFHYSDNLITRPYIQTNSVELWKYWETFLVGKPRVYGTFKVIDFLVFSAFVIICSLRIRTISNFTLAVFAFTISQLLLTSFLMPDPRYRGFSDILIILSLFELSQTFLKRRELHNV
jgi:hypothetical protein